MSSRRFSLMPAYTSAEPRNVWERVAGRGGRLHDMDLATPRAWAQPGGLPELHLFKGANILNMDNQMDMADDENHRLTAGFVEKYFAMWKNMGNSQRYIDISFMTFI